MTLQIEEEQQNGSQLVVDQESSQVGDENSSASLQEQQASATPTVQSEKTSAGRRNPPARNTSRFWFERFLSVIQRQNPSVIDSSFLSQIAPSNEGKLLAQLKFIRVIDDQGKPTPLLPLLNLVGEAQKKGFREMVRDSYTELLAEVKIDRAVPDDIVNYFIRKYAFTRDKAINASKFFLYLADKGSMQVSQELGAFYSEKSSAPSGLAQAGSANVSIPSPKVVDRTSRIAVPRETRPMTAVSSARNGSSQRRSIRARYLVSESQAAIQATIEIKLDKDTPKEYWDRVLALLGEKRKDNDAESTDVADANAGEEKPEES